MKSIAGTEIILAVGIIIAIGVSLVQLRGVFYGQQLLAQEEVVVAFARDLEEIVDKAIATTGDAAFVYYPSIKKYTVDINNNIVSIFDKTSNKTVGFSKSAPEIINNYLEDCDKIFVIKTQEKIVINCRCLELGEACKNSLLCCSGYCNETSKKCEEMPICPAERICEGAPESKKDVLGKDCCPIDLPVCTNEHCCPTDKPKWCNKPKDGEARCMSEEDYNNPNKCKRANFKILFIQLNGKISNFKQKAEAGKDVWVSLTPLSKCPGSVEAIVEENKICNVPDQSSLCSSGDSVADATLNAIRSCAQSWGYNDYTRVEGVLPGDWVCTVHGGGITGYTNIYYDVLVSSEGHIRGTSSHEMGHTFGLCDEGYGNAYCSECDNGNGICGYGGMLCCNSVSASTCESVHTNTCFDPLSGQSGRITTSGYNCPDRPESNSIMCTSNPCGRGCSPGNSFAPTSYAHLEKELNKYC